MGNRRGSIILFGAGVARHIRLKRSVQWCVEEKQSPAEAGLLPAWAKLLLALVNCRGAGSFVFDRAAGSPIQCRIGLAGRGACA